MAHLEGLLPAGDLRLPTELLDAIDRIAPPGGSINVTVDVPSGETKDQLRRGR